MRATLRTILAIGAVAAAAAAPAADTHQFQTQAQTPPPSQLPPRPGAPPRDATQEAKKGSAVIRGRVVAGDSGRLRRRPATW